MAGIAGILGDQVSPDTIDRLLACLHHRGPDIRNVARSDTCCLGVCASTLSEARGDGYVQDGYVTVIVDGEIHNPRSGNPRTLPR
jgi:asparagine synthetase B (glutamine-hydrolysing)